MHSTPPNCILGYNLINLYIPFPLLIDRNFSRRFPLLAVAERQKLIIKLCEYCHALEKWQYVAFTIDHVIPLTKGGDDTLDNLALACFHCNRCKGNVVSIKDSTSGEDIPLFNPNSFTRSQCNQGIIGFCQKQRQIDQLNFVLFLKS